MSEEKMSFDDYNLKLQEIVKKLEKNDVSVEEGTKLYEEGVKIAKRCFEILNKCKGKVVVLKKELDALLPDEQKENDEDF